MFLTLVLAPKPFAGALPNKDAADDSCFLESFVSFTGLSTAVVANKELVDDELKLSKGDAPSTIAAFPWNFFNLDLLLSVPFVLLIASVVVFFENTSPTDDTFKLELIILVLSKSLLALLIAVF